MEARLTVALQVAEEAEGRRAQALPAGGAATPFAAGKEERAAQPEDPEEGVAAVDEAEAAASGIAALPANPEDTNVWPTAAEEAAFLSDARVRGEPVVPVARETAEDAQENAKALPNLEELVNRIPAETRELLDELFRVKFVAVRRVRKSDLKG